MQFEAASSCVIPKQRCDEEATYRKKLTYLGSPSHSVYAYPLVETKFHSNTQRVGKTQGTDVNTSFSVMRGLIAIAVKPQPITFKQTTPHSCFSVVVLAILPSLIPQSDVSLFWCFLLHLSFIHPTYMIRPSFELCSSLSSESPLLNLRQGPATAQEGNSSYDSCCGQSLEEVPASVV